MSTERLRSVTHLVSVLTRGHRSDDAGEFGAGSRLDLLSHSLQSAHEAYLMRPADEELQVAALVHDIGWLVATTDRVTRGDHAVVGALAVAPLLGDRVARLVALHADAERYLAATDLLFTPPSIPPRHDLVDELRPMTGAEMLVFELVPAFHDALLLAAADRLAREPGRLVPSLVSWLPVVTALIDGAASDDARASDHG